MFEEQPNTGKSASLAEKYANALGQLSEESDGRAQAEHALEVERLTREEIIRAEVARQVAEERKRIEAEVEAAYAKKSEELDARKQELEQREAKLDEKAETAAQNLNEQVLRQMSAARTRFEKSALNRLADMFEMFMQAFLAVGDKDSVKGQELLTRYQKAAEGARSALQEEVKDKLAKVEAKNKSKTEQVTSLVRMIFTQKRERFVLGKNDRESIYNEVMDSLEFTPEEKKRYRESCDFCEDYRRRKAIYKLLKSQVEHKGHGRNPLPENLPLCSPCYEDVFWKSYASAELLAKMENAKYVLHLPFNRQIKKMKQDGLSVSPSTVNDWHEGVCDFVEPLYELQKERVMSSMLLSADGSPFPILDCEKHKTVNHYLIQYRSVTTGIPIFLVNTKNKHGRGKADIMDNLKDWTGLALMCDAYSGYDWLKKINGRILCRCVVHARRPMERALKENPKLAKVGLLFYQNINLIEEMIKEKGLHGAEKAQFRKDNAEPIWENFKLWVSSVILDVPQDSLIFKALNYMLRNYNELTNYIDIPDMPLDNNQTESLMRDMVMGKKSYLFCRDLDACKRAAMMYSLFGACKVLGKNPERWLCYVLKHINSTPKDKLYTLLPEFWEDINEQ